MNFHYVASIRKRKVYHGKNGIIIVKNSFRNNSKILKFAKIQRQYNEAGTRVYNGPLLFSK